jgi:hypothetical protein
MVASRPPDRVDIAWKGRAIVAKAARAHRLNVPSERRRPASGWHAGRPDYLQSRSATSDEIGQRE